MTWIGKNKEVKIENEHHRIMQLWAGRMKGIHTWSDLQTM